MPSFQQVVRKQTMLARSEPSMISAAALASIWTPTRDLSREIWLPGVCTGFYRTSYGVLCE
jgi:hypothetical protein